MPTAIRIENVSKQYRLGQVGTGTLSHDLNRWWAKFRGKEDPYQQVGQVNRRDQAADGKYVWALQDINLEVEQGEVLGIIGANGAGKSTLLKLISRITSPTTGEIKARGRIASLLEVGTGMHPEMTARENIYLNGTILGMRRHEIKRKFDEIIDFAGCRMYVDTPVKRFSSGMRVRLGFAVAAFLEPEILIVDEVLAVGDSEFQRKAVDKMKSVSEDESRTILFVSHNMNSVANLCTRVALMQHGTIKSVGPTDQMVEQYLEDAQALSDDVIENEFIQIERMTIHSDEQETSLIRCGGSLLMSATVVNKTNQSGMKIGFTFKDKTGMKVVVFHTHFYPDVELPDEATFQVNCAVPCLPLVPGKYQVDVSFTDKNDGLLARFQSVQQIEVIFDDYLKTGLLPQKKNGVFVAPCDWQVVELNETANG